MGSRNRRSPARRHAYSRRRHDVATGRRDAHNSRLLEAAQAVIAAAEPDDDFEGDFVDYLVPFEEIDALRAVVASEGPDLAPMTALELRAQDGDR